MSDWDLKLEPHQIGDAGDRWWYEQPSGIIVLAELRDPNGEYLGTTETKIPWTSIRAALKRKDK